MGTFFLTLISQIGLKAIFAALSTLLTGGLVTLFLHERKKAKEAEKEANDAKEKAKEDIAKLRHNLELEGKHYDEKKKKLEKDREKMEEEYKQKDQEWIDERSRLKNDLENTKESAENAKYATLTVGALYNILILETQEAKLKGTQWFKKDIKGAFPITKKMKRGLFKKDEEITEYYYDYYVGVKQYSLNLSCGVNLQDVKVRKDSDGNIKIYGLELTPPTRNFDDDYKLIYWTVLRYPAKLIKDENGKEYRKPDESKYRDVREEYNKKQEDEKSQWEYKKQQLDTEIEKEFKQRFKVKNIKKEIGEKEEKEYEENYEFIYDNAKKQAQMFLKGVFAPYVDDGKKIMFLDEPEDPSSVKTLQDFCSQTKILEWHK